MCYGMGDSSTQSFQQNANAASNHYEEIRIFGSLFRSKMCQTFDSQTVLHNPVDYFEKTYPFRFLNVKG